MAMINEFGHCDAGLNHYRFRASLGICHPQLPAQVIGERLSMVADRSHNIGDGRKTPKGNPLPGQYSSTYWEKNLPVESECSFGDFIARFAADFAGCKATLNEIHETGGRVDLYIQLFAEGLCDDIIPCELLTQLGNLKVDLRLDFYAKSTTSESRS